MKAVILLGTLKSKGLSNTETLSEFLINKLTFRSVECELIKLVDFNIRPGTYTRLEEPDDWPALLEQILSANIVLFATPIWWGNHSSEIQKIIERLDHLHDEILEGKQSRLSGKSGGIIITGDSDGAQHIIANIANFFNAIGILMPPFASLSVLNEIQKKGAATSKEELLKIYEEQYSSTADTMIDQLLKFG